MLPLELRMNPCDIQEDVVIILSYFKHLVIDSCFKRLVIFIFLRRPIIVSYLLSVSNP